MSTLVADPAPASVRAGRNPYTWVLVALGILVAVSAVRVITGEHEIDTPGSLRAALIATCPILMAALGGLWAERAGVVNIGLEGQMILGTWGAAYFTYYYGPWIGILGAALLGAIGGALHALATVTFGVDHIVSGVAINIIGLGASQFLAEAYFAPAVLLAVSGWFRDGGIPSEATAVDWAFVLGTGAITALPLLLFAFAAQRVPFTLLGPTNYLVPLINFLLGWLVYDEALPPSRMVGFGLVWCALVLVTTDTIRRSSSDRGRVPVPVR